MKSLYEVTPWSGSEASSSSDPPSRRSVTAMWKPLSISALPSRLPCQASSAEAKLSPGGWITKSTWQVVPPKAADVCPDSKSSAVTVPPKGMSRCVCGSTHPGSTYLPVASTTRSAATSSDSPMREIRSPSTRTSPT
jgi:hypothetical protein